MVLGTRKSTHSHCLQTAHNLRGLSVARAEMETQVLCWCTEEEDTQPERTRKGSLKRDDILEEMLTLSWQVAIGCFWAL